MVRCTGYQGEAHRYRTLSARPNNIFSSPLKALYAALGLLQVHFLILVLGRSRRCPLILPHQAIMTLALGFTMAFFSFHASRRLHKQVR
jgi:hypothetical protein